MKEQSSTGNKVIGYVLWLPFIALFLYSRTKAATGQAQMDKSVLKRSLPC